ncbi:hypothetical protein [Candidatus Uabimicrobium sp. HlEnr_7]|uniref:hypothetical protein n=1 Tax=Candidatus Uabimicrobium helgolandensis TaxID=3095367 RepID=UPI003555D13F
MKWILVFVTIIVLSQDYWNFSSQANLQILGFPKVVVYFFVLQLFLALAIGAFSIKIWQEDK